MDINRVKSILRSLIGCVGRSLGLTRRMLNIAVLSKVLRGACTIDKSEATNQMVDEKEENHSDW